MNRGVLRDLRNDAGSSLILIVFAGLLCVGIAISVATATSLYVERKRLFSLADAAALVGAESFDLERVRIIDGHVIPVLESATVRHVVTDFVTSFPSTSLNGVRVEKAVTLDGLSATVTLSSLWRPPVVSLFLPAGMRIEVTTVGRSVFTPS